MISARLLREARLRAGLSQAELARRAGKSASVIGRWERGEVKPPLETLLHLVRAAGFELGVSLTPLDDHDRVLIRRALRQPPEERLANMVRAVAAFEAMTAASRRG